MTNSELPTAEADITHRRHAIIETTFADLIDGPLAHIPSGLFAANCAWLACAVIAHNLLRAAGTLAGGNHAVARGATLRRDLVNVPARFAAPARKPMLHLPAHWPWQTGWKTLWDNVIGSTRPPNPVPPDPTIESLSTPPSQARPEEPRNKEKLVQASRSRMRQANPRPAASHQNRRRPLEITHPRIQLEDDGPTYYCACSELLGARRCSIAGGPGSDRRRVVAPLQAGPIPTPPSLGPAADAPAGARC